jgi:hypothetical protein
LAGGQRSAADDAHRIVHRAGSHVRGAILIVVVASVAVAGGRAEARAKFVPCASVTQTNMVELKGVGQESPPTCNALGVFPWCDADGRTVGCCAGGLSWSASGCVCAAPRKLDDGHCCGAKEHWTKTGDSSLGAGGGLCCPPGESPTRAYGGGHSDGGPIPTVYTCCPDGETFDRGSCIERMTCVAGESGLTPAARFVSCNGSPVRSAASTTARARVVIGPVIDSTREGNAAAKIAAQQQKALTECYVGSHADAAGFLIVQLTIDAAGRVTQASLTADTLHDGSVESCVLQALHAVTWPAAGAQLLVPLAFPHPRHPLKP